MPGGLPRQLRWSDFKRVLDRLGYSLCHSKRGSARTFRNPNRDPELVTFHEPHGSSTLRQGTLREYLRKLKISVEEFDRLLKD